MANTSYTVVGMTCDHCVSAVRTEISLIKGVVDVAVDLTSGQVSVESAEPIADATVAAAVAEAGYAVAP